VPPNSIITKPKGAYRVLHTADWHLGKMLGEHSRELEHRLFLSYLLDRIRDLSVDALLVAGDVFDSASPPQSAVAQYYDFLSALFRLSGCAVIIVAGNHDSPAHLEAPRQILKAIGAHVIGAMPSSSAEALVPLPDAKTPRLLVAAVPFLRDRDLRIGQSGQSATDIQRALVEGIKRRYNEVTIAAKPWTDQGIPMLATGHLTVVGSKASDSEREIHVGGLGAVGVDCFPNSFDYVALGHLHRPQAAGQRETVRYAGSPIPLSFSEAEDRKAVHVLDFAEGKLVQQFMLELPLARRLVQLTASRQALESILAGFQPPATEFPAWVELVIEDPVPGENVFERVQEMARGKTFQVIRVIQKPTNLRSGLSPAVVTDVDGIADLLAEPANVFAHRLEAESGLTEVERESLKTVFKELLELHSEQPRIAQAAGTPTSNLAGKS
jgi:exonuclease SbcD